MKTIIFFSLSFFLLGCKARQNQPVNSGLKEASALNGPNFCRTKKTSWGYADSAVDEITFRVFANSPEFKDQQGNSYDVAEYPLWLKIDASFKDKRKNLIYESPASGSLSPDRGTLEFFEPIGSFSLTEGSLTTMTLDEKNGDVLTGRIRARNYKRSEVLFTNMLTVICTTNAN